MGKTNIQILLHILLFLIAILAIGLCRQSKVYYNRLAGNDVSIKCAILGMSGSNSAVRSLDGSDSCQVLPINWSGTIASGYTYLKRNTTVETYEDDDFFINYFLPGTVTVGTKFEVAFQTPLSTTWSNVYLTLRTTNSSLRFVRILLIPTNKVWISSIDNEDMYIQRGIFSVMYDTNFIYKASIVPMESQFQVTFVTQDTSFVHYLDYVHLAPPEDFKFFRISGFFPRVRQISFLND